MFFAEGVCVIFPSSHNEWEDRDNAFEDAFWLKFGRKEEAEIRCWLNSKCELCGNFYTPLIIIVNNHGLNQLLCEICTAANPMEISL